jgi:hypothetical protein
VISPRVEIEIGLLIRRRRTSFLANLGAVLRRTPAPRHPGGMGPSLTCCANGRAGWGRILYSAGVVVLIAILRRRAAVTLCHNNTSLDGAQSQAGGLRARTDILARESAGGTGSRESLITFASAEAPAVPSPGRESLSYPLRPAVSSAVAVPAS